MSVYLRPCSRCRLIKKERSTDQRGRKMCRNCKWIAVAPPKLGRKSLGVYTTKDAAEAAYRDALVKHYGGIELESRATTVEKIVSQYLQANSNRLSPMTSHRYQQLWDTHAASSLGRLKVADIRPAHIDSLYCELQGKMTRRKTLLSRRSVHHVHRFLFTVFAWGERKNFIKNNPMRKVEAPTPDQSPARDLTPDEAAAFFEASRQHELHPFFVLAAATGARRGELAALTWDAVNLEDRSMMIRQAIGSRFERDREGNIRRIFFVKGTKTGRPRKIPLNADAIAALRLARSRRATIKLAQQQRYHDGGFVFTDELGHHINPDTASHAFADIARGVGLRGVSLHSLRHSVASWAIADGLDIITVAALLGHSTPAITLRTYGHIQLGSQERAVHAIGNVLGEAKSRRRALKASTS